MPGGDAVIISLSRLNRIRAIDPANNTLTAEGRLRARCRAVAAASRRRSPVPARWLPLVGAAGGNLSTNAGGVQVLRYGNTRELTLGLEVVLPSGRNLAMACAASGRTTPATISSASLHRRRRHAGHHYPPRR